MSLKDKKRTEKIIIIAIVIFSVAVIFAVGLSWGAYIGAKFAGFPLKIEKNKPESASSLEEVGEKEPIEAGKDEKKDEFLPAIINGNVGSVSEGQMTVSYESFLVPGESYESIVLALTNDTDIRVLENKTEEEMAADLKQGKAKAKELNEQKKANKEAIKANGCVYSQEVQSNECQELLEEQIRLESFSEEVNSLLSNKKVLSGQLADLKIGDKVAVKTSYDEKSGQNLALEITIDKSSK